MDLYIDHRYSEQVWKNEAIEKKSKEDLEELQTGSMDESCQSGSLHEIFIRKL